jgi:hypothetical protein
MRLDGFDSFQRRLKNEIRSNRYAVDAVDADEN